MNTNNVYHPTPKLPIDGWLHPCIKCKVITSHSLNDIPMCQICIKTERPGKIENSQPEQIISINSVSNSQSREINKDESLENNSENNEDRINTNRIPDYLCLFLKKRFNT